MVIYEKDEKLLVKEFQFDSQCTMVEFEENGEVRVFKDEVEDTESNLNYVYREFRKGNSRYALYDDGQRPILFHKLDEDPLLSSIGKNEILEKSLEYCQKAYKSVDETNGFLSIGTDATKIIGTNQAYSTKIFWANERSRKILYIAFRGTVDSEKDEFLDDWMTNLDLNLVEDERGKYYFKTKKKYLAKSPCFLMISYFTNFHL